MQRRDILHSNAGKECYQNYSGPKLAHSRVKFAVNNKLVRVSYWKRNLKEQKLSMVHPF